MSNASELTPQLQATQLALRLLIVMDAIADLQEITLILEAVGLAFCYDLATTADNCQNFLQQNTYDAVLSAYNLPTLNGLEILKILQESSQNIPFILITNALGDAVAVQCLKAGITDYILKEQLFCLPEILIKSIQKSKQTQKLLVEINSLLASSLNFDCILQSIVKILGASFEAERVTIYTQTSEQTEVINEWRISSQISSVLCYRGTLSQWVNQFEITELPPDECFQSPIKLANATYLQKKPACSVLIIPIFIGKQLLGGISLQNIQEKTFLPKERQDLEQIASSLALVLYSRKQEQHLKTLTEQMQRLEAEKQLLETANQAKSIFIANMSHELRTPITGVLGFSRLLSEQIFGSLNNKQQQYIDGIYTSGEHMLALINELLDLSKIEAGREELDLETIFLDKVCQQALALVNEQALQKNLQLRLEIEPNLTTCIADYRRCKQILVNLLFNAVKFTESGSITLKVEQTTDWTRFLVIDTGIGLSEADQAKLFQPFRQFARSVNYEHKGTGLGLALSLKLAKLHGGKITVISQLGSGSCFTLSLPVLQN